VSDHTVIVASRLPSSSSSGCQSSSDVSVVSRVAQIVYPAAVVVHQHGHENVSVPPMRNLTLLKIMDMVNNRHLTNLPFNHETPPTREVYFPCPNGQSMNESAMKNRGLKWTI
jgi:hypothetical protein